MIDVHAHAAPLAYLACLKRFGITPMQSLPMPPGAPPPLPMGPATDQPEHIAARIALMDAAGVGTQILSPTYAPYLDLEAEAVEAARTVNLEICAMAAKAPGRLAGFASLPLPHIQASLDALAHGLDTLGMAGVTLQCFCGERSVADPYFEPVFAELNRRGAVLFIHPCINGLCSRFINEWKLTAAAGPTFEDAVTGMHMMVSGIPHRYPDIRIIIAHLGGGLATQIKRLDNQLPYFAELAEAPSVTARRMWYDTCCHGSAAAMHSAIEAFGADRLLPGSDYPFLTIHEPLKDTFAFMDGIGLSADDREAILHGNARNLFPHLADSSPGSSRENSAGATGSLAQ